MIFVFEKGTNKFIGMAPSYTDGNVEKEHTLAELYPNLDPQKVGFLLLKDSPKFAMDNNNWQWKLDKSGTPVGIEYKPILSIHVMTNARDADGDGLPEILAASDQTLTPREWEYAEIRVQLMDGQKKSGTVTTVKLSTDAGILESRILTTDKTGYAMTRLRATMDTVTINVIATGDNLRQGSIALEVMPSKDFEKLHGVTLKS